MADICRRHDRRFFSNIFVEIFFCRVENEIFDWKRHWHENDRFLLWKKSEKIFFLLQSKIRFSVTIVFGVDGFTCELSLHTIGVFCFESRFTNKIEHHRTIPFEKRLFIINNVQIQVQDLTSKQRRPTEKNHSE
jgi:hypothetical protein